ncbi:MAG: nucleotidyl transferase AbiEii/AbiGii toxin family protein [Thermodesulfobacteriota bacterium]
MKEKIVLTGGAATQFYLPIEYQRTSVDIDMNFVGEIEEVEDTLGAIERKLKGSNDLFKARPHKPKDPKTHLPLMTYYMNVPSVCTAKELFGKKTPGTQEIKIEFHFTDKPLAIHPTSSPRIFALETRQTYQLLPLNDLIGDKLTTLGPHTVGIPMERADEQIKQIYDISWLLKFNWDNIDLPGIKKAFLTRAKSEARQRFLTEIMEDIFTDMLEQMRQLSVIDLGNDKTLLKRINDFQSLYVRKELNRSPAEWAINGAMILLLLVYFSRNINAANPLNSLFECEQKLEFNHLQGTGKGRLVRLFREEFSKAFEKYSNYPAKVLKGKSPARILWAVVNPDNVDEIVSWIHNFIEDER